MKIKPQQILVTGASTGIGYDLVRALCEQGHRVWAGVRKPEVLQDLERLHHQTLTVLRLDVTSEADIQACFEKVRTELDASKEFAIINNAGIALGGPIETLPLKEWKSVFEINVFGLIAVTKTFLPLLRGTKGRIVNIGSISGRVASPFLAPYSSSKFAVRAFTDSLRREVQGFGVRVTLIEPGPINTGIWNKSLAESDRQEALMSNDMRAIYGPAVQTLRAGVEQSAREAVPVSEVTQKFLMVLASKNPPPYVLIGKNIRLMAALTTWLPTKTLDKLMARGFRGSRDRSK